MNKRKRKRTLAKKARRQARLNSTRVQSTPARASKYLHHLEEYQKDHPDIKAVIYCRVSACTQGHKGNLHRRKKLVGLKGFVLPELDNVRLYPHFNFPLQRRRHYFSLRTGILLV
jgi:hypothetical protein